MKSFKMAFVAFALLIASSNTYAKVTISPYVSISSQKKIEPAKAGGNTANETVKQRTTYGIAAGVSFWRIMSLQLSVGQNKLDETRKTSEVVDEFGEIDFQKDLNMDVSDQDAEVKTSETQRKARVTLVFDPGFWIFIARLKAGVQAQQRLMTLEQNGTTESYTGPITYDPVASLGFGVKFGPRMYAMAEYGAVFYKFPETEPFEREVTVSYGINF